MTSMLGLGEAESPAPLREPAVRRGWFPERNWAQLGPRSGRTRTALPQGEAGLAECTKSSSASNPTSRALSNVREPVNRLATTRYSTLLGQRLDHEQDPADNKRVEHALRRCPLLSRRGDSSLYPTSNSSLGSLRRLHAPATCRGSHASISRAPCPAQCLSSWPTVTRSRSSMLRCQRTFTATPSVA